MPNIGLKFSTTVYSSLFTVFKVRQITITGFLTQKKRKICKILCTTSPKYFFDCTGFSVLAVVSLIISPQMSHILNSHYLRKLCLIFQGENFFSEAATIVKRNRKGAKYYQQTH